MQEFDSIKDMIYCEIDEISRKEQLDMNTVKVLGELVDILKDLGYIEAFEEGVQVYEDEYDFGGGSRGYSQKRMPVYYGNSYRGGYSRNGGGMNGGYSGRRGMRGYSRDDAKGHMIHKLEELMNEAVDQKDRESIQRLIDQMEK